MNKEVVMRGKSYILTLALGGALVLLCSLVSAQPYSQHRSGVQIDVGIFYDDLAPYGEWVEMPDYGWAWAPRVERGWRPYTRGHWVMTDYGWFWVSDERFGWAAYHYGRWVNDPYYGWIWVPGTEWAPAWVSWRHGDGYIGWAPLPPRATWQTRVGLNIGGFEIDAFIGARDYAFVPDRAFMDRGVYQRILPPTQNVTIINVTNNVTNYTFVNERVVNGGIAVESVERAVGRRVARARTVDVDRADAPRRAGVDEVAVFRPEVRAAPERKPAHGRSLIKGDEPPPLLVERRKAREQERQQKGHEPEVTAKDVEQQRPAAHPRDKKHDAAGQQQTPDKDTSTQQPEGHQQQGQAGQEADKQRAKDQEQQRMDREQRRGEAQQQRDQAGQEADKQRAKDQEQQRMDREQRQGKAHPQPDQEQLDQQRPKRGTEAQAEPGKRAKEAKDDPKDKGKKKPKDKGEKNPEASPTPPPEGQQQ
jgi:hypothetical protein